MFCTARCSLHDNRFFASFLTGRYSHQVAAAIFASPPTGTYEEALAHFETAEKTKPGFYISNRLMLAKTHLQLKNRQEAKHWLDKTLELEVIGRSR